MQVAHVSSQQISDGLLDPAAAVIQATGGKYLVARLLTAEWVRRASNRYRLVSYDWLRQYTRDIQEVLEVRELWRQVFHEPPPDDLVDIDLECEFAGKVHRERFPLVLAVYDDYFNSGMEDSILLGAGIVFESWGLAWEMAALADMPDVVRPLLACILPPFLEWRDYDDMDWREDVARWWGQRGYAESPRPLWARQIGLSQGEWNEDLTRQIIETLDQLDQPLDGLGVVMRLCVRSNDNTFLDTVDYRWRAEYDEHSFDWWPWDAGSVEEFTREWQQAKPSIEVAEQYSKWFEQNKPQSEERVIEILLGLDEMLGLEEDDDDRE